MKEILHAMYKFTMKKLIMAGHYSKRLLHLKPADVFPTKITSVTSTAAGQGKHDRKLSDLHLSFLFLFSYRSSWTYH